MTESEDKATDQQRDTGSYQAIATNRRTLAFGEPPHVSDVETPEAYSACTGAKSIFGPLNYECRRVDSLGQYCNLGHILGAITFCKYSDSVGFSQ